MFLPVCDFNKFDLKNESTWPECNLPIEFGPFGKCKKSERVVLIFNDGSIDDKHYFMSGRCYKPCIISYDSFDYPLMVAPKHINKWVDYDVFRKSFTWVNEETLQEFAPTNKMWMDVAKHNNIKIDTKPEQE